MKQDTLWEGSTPYGHYEVVDTLYDGRPARVLYSGDRQAAQSGVAKDDRPDLLFDYNQRFMELAEALAPRKVLIIGGGVYTMATALLARLPDVAVDVVEPNPLLRELAERFFDLPDTPQLRHFETDGRTFLRESSEHYDMLIVDAFMHTTIPPDLTTLEAMQMLASHLSPNGVAAMNVISSYHGRSSHVIRELYAAFIGAFDAVDIFYASRGYTLWLPQNFVMAGQLGRGAPLKDYVRYEPLVPPEVSPDEARKDREL